MSKQKKLYALTLLMSMLIFAVLSPNIGVEAQGDATVVFLTTVGGTTDPTGTQTYPDGQQITMTATPTDTNFIFERWIIQADSTASEVFDNPATLTVMGGATYAIEAVFAPLLPPPPITTLPIDLSTSAIVVVLPSAGGTTSPAPGTYALADATQTTLTATPDSGFQFSHWVISAPSGTPTDQHPPAGFNPNPTDNPYTIDHGYGNTYRYQAVFTQTGSTPAPTGGASPPPTDIMGLSMETWIIIALVVVIAVILIAFGVFASRRRH